MSNTTRILKRTTQKISLLFFALLAMTTVAQQPVPAPEKPVSVLFTNATLHIGNGTVIENGALGMDDGKITFVGEAKDAKSRKFKTVKDLEGARIYPGLIAVNVPMGLIEIDAVRATRDFLETGDFTPEARAQIAYNTDSRIIPTVRNNGVLLVQSTPLGGKISGTSSVMKMDGWNWEDATYRADDGIHLNWPKQYAQSGWWAEPGETKRDSLYTKRVEEIHDFFEKAAAYRKHVPEKEKDLRLEAMRGIFNGKQILYVKADQEREIMHVLYFKQKFDIKNLVIVGGKEAHLVAEHLVQDSVPVILANPHSLPERNEDHVYHPYREAKLLHEKGVLFCLTNTGRMEAMNTRNLPFLAGTTAAHGLDKELALMAITLNAAKILKIEKRTGSLEVGKDANLFISTGDALDMLGNQVTEAYLEGRPIDLTDHQKQLYERFKAKYENAK